MNIMDQFNAAAGQLQAANAIKHAVGNALTDEQQIAISSKVIDGVGPFVRWAATDAGRNAIRAMADAFIDGGVK
jgi:hypothetical protein